VGLVTANFSKKIGRNRKNGQNRLLGKENVEAKCAGCGGDSPEYFLDDRQLCVECYAGEGHFCAKDCKA
jgi:hypothetical protein